MSLLPTVQQRSEVIERAINIEWLMALVICQHYLHKVLWPFLVEVLYDENFSFGLKVAIILKICKPTTQQEQDLRCVNRIRNQFAHLGPHVATSARPSEFFIPDPRRPDRPIDFAALYHEFQSLAGRVEEFLGQALLARGGQLTEKPPAAT
ncbi:MAG: hypothetical protein A2Y78_14650 [Acidobacteria bacterium RBG_13_68_16]|nr:MAG: hypothetical protein A2Y78_14650 [Acidobacteria bacterium RBG_13_68_16]